MLRRPLGCADVGAMNDLVVWLDAIGMGDVARVGGKTASLGEMVTNLASVGVKVPDGFATTATAYRRFLAHSGLEEVIGESLAHVDIDDVEALAAAAGGIRDAFLQAPLPTDLVSDVEAAYHSLEEKTGVELSVAVRSSATAEDLPEASFAGQQDTYLNVRDIDEVLLAMRRVFSSLFTDRAIAYRTHHGFAHDDVALSVCIQQMVRSDLGTSGVMFTIDTESGFDEVVLINASYGLGELVVQGGVNPDEFVVYKPALRAGRSAILRRRLGGKERRFVYGADGAGTVTEEVPPDARARFSLGDADVEELGRLALRIEDHYGRPMDIEWGLDGRDGSLHILQARPETVQSRNSGQVVERFHITERGDVLATGRSVGQRIGVGTARVVEHVSNAALVENGDVLITDMTDPDWEPVMRKAAAIVTNRGGRTCHAAIIARELGIPAVVGTGSGTETVTSGRAVTVSCAEGDVGYVYAGSAAFDVQRIELDRMPASPVKVMMNVATPDRAFLHAQLPNEGIGLARIEFIVTGTIGIHPRTIVDYAQLPPELRSEVDRRTVGYADARSFYVEKLREGVAVIAAAFAPKPVIVRLSDFKSNEYSHLLGGDRYEPTEENPMIGFRGASRYLDKTFAEAFALECEALRMVRDGMGLTNLEVMVPFVRTVDEARQVTEALKAHGLERGRDGLRLIMMCEVPSNALLADEFLRYFDGYSIGSNDLTQLTLALDRDSGLVADLFDERNAAVKALIEMAVQACRRGGKYIGICGQGPSDHPDFAGWLAEIGLDSLSLNPDTVVETWLQLAGEKA